jgi:hypothetical protein
VSACGGRVQASEPHTQTPQINWKPVNQAIGKVGVAMADGIHRYSFPRTDLAVTVQGVHLKAGFALGGYAAFLPMGNGAMAMGDLVLNEDEINPCCLRHRT